MHHNDHMNKSAADETVYIKVAGKYKPYGKVWDREALPYGTWFVENKQHSKGLRHIESMPEFLGLESAIEESKQELCRHVQEYFNTLEPKPLSYWDLTELISKAVRDTIIKKQREMIHTIKHGHEK